MTVAKKSNSTNSTAFGLSKHLAIPISAKICYLQPAPAPAPAPASQLHQTPQKSGQNTRENGQQISKSIASSSLKYKNPEVFEKLSNISVNSDLYVRLELFDHNNNRITEPVQSSYKPFSNNRRVWNTYVKLPINYNQIDYHAYMKVSLVEIVQTRPQTYCSGHVSLFNHKNGTLRRGSLKIPLWSGDQCLDVPVNYADLEMSELETAIADYDDGRLERIDWLDKMVFETIDKERTSSDLKSLISVGSNVQISSEVLNIEPGSSLDRSNLSESNFKSSITHYLFLELPNFLLPIVYLDIPTKQDLHLTIADRPTVPESNQTDPKIIVNLIDIPSPNSLKLYDPRYDEANMINFNREDQIPTSSGIPQPATIRDPIESKYHKLATNIINNPLLDKEIKPSPHMRDELWKILNMASNATLSDLQKKLLWKFRYYFSQNSTSDDPSAPASAPLKATRQFLTKFLKCFNWENEYELDHVFSEILPYWSVDRIDIGDALELLSNTFSPNTLTAGLRHRKIAATNISGKDINTNEEKKIEKIFHCSKRLRVFAVDRLRLASPDELLLYLLQLVQALKYETLLARGNALDEDTLATFLILRAVECPKLGNFFYWFVKVENEDQLNRNANRVKPSEDQTNSYDVDGIINAMEENSIKDKTWKDSGPMYSVVLNTYIEKLKQHCQRKKLPHYSNLKRQIAFIKKLTNLVDILRNNFKKNETTSKKAQFLQEYLADSSNGMVKFSEPFPLPLDPSVVICGCYPSECSVFKSSLAPLKITFKTILESLEPVSSASSVIFRSRPKKYGKYSLMFKIGDDLRQDQLVIQLISLMDQLLKNENMNLKLTPYKILATSPIAGLIQFVPNETLDSVLTKNYLDVVPPLAVPDPVTGIATPANGILSYLQLHSRLLQKEEPEEDSVLGKKATSLPQKHAITADLRVSSLVMDNYVKSCAGYCVITYLLGVGDRHLDNLLLSPNGKFWHADFGYILGRDPKPFPPLMKLPIQVIDGMGGMDHENFKIFESYCFVTYTTLRRNSNLILNLFQLMLNANIPDILIDPSRAVEKVQEKFALEISEEEAILHFQNLIIDSVNAFLPVVIDRLHSLAQYWRA